MKPEASIKQAKSDSRLRELATNNNRTLEEANELVDLLLNYVAVIQTSILDIRDRMATQEGAIETLADMVAPKDGNGLVGFEKPELIGIDKRKPN